MIEGTQIKHMPQETTNFMTSVRAGIDSTPLVKHENGISIINAISEQNQYFKHQQQTLMNELKKLKNVSDSLLDQNQKMRAFYRGRTFDIQKIIKTIEINMEQEINDYQHRQFLMKELNCAILKEIKQIMKNREEVQARINVKKDECMSINEEKIRLDHEIYNKIKINIENNLNQTAINDLKKEEKMISNENDSLMKQINELIVANKEQQNILYNDRNEKENMKQNYTNKKDQIRLEVNALMKENQKYKDEIQKQTQYIEKIKQSNQVKEQKFNSATNRLKDAVKNYQKLQTKHSELNNHKENLKAKINISFQKREDQQKKLQEIEQLKEDWADKIEKKKKNIDSLCNSKAKSLDEMSKNHIKALKLVKQNLQNLQIASNDDILKLKRQRECCDFDCNNNEIQYRAVTEEVNEYQKLIKGLNNPIAEIERTQLLMRLSKNRVN